MIMHSKPHQGIVLVVDDEPVNLKLLSIMLAEHGYVVRTSVSGPLALESVNLEIPDVILLDIDMPEMDGYEVCQALKSNDQTRNIPVIFVSAFERVNHKIEAFRAGGIDYITKPFQFEEVLARVTTHVALQNMHKQVLAQNTRLQKEIHERQRVEEALRLSEERYTRATEAAGVGVWEWHLKTGDFFVAENVKTLLGYEAETVGNNVRDWIKLIHTDDMTQFVNMSREYLEGQRAVFEAEYRLRRCDSSFHWIHIRGSVVIYDTDGQPVKLSGTITDINDQKQAKEALRLSEQMLENTFTSMRDAVFIIDANTVRILDCNPAATTIFGYTRADMLGLTTSFLHTDVLAVEEFKSHLFSSVQHDTQNTFPVRPMKRKDGTILYTEHSIMPMEDIQGKRIGWVDVVRDITERKKVEEELRQAREVLEQRVQERTAALVETNKALSNEIEERKQREREREIIIQVADSLRVATNRRYLITIFLEKVFTLLHAHGTILFSLNPTCDKLVVEQGYGILATLQGHILNIEELEYMATITEEWLKEKIPFVAPETEHVVCIPLLSEDDAIGVFGLIRQEHIFEEDKHIMRSVGDMAANAIRRMYLHEQTERRLQRIQALHTIDQTITTSLNLQVTLNVLIYQVTSQLLVDAASVLLLNPNTHRLEYAAGHGFKSMSIQRSHLHLGEGLAGQAAEKQSLVQVPNLQHTMHECVRADILKKEGFVSYYAIPLIARDRVKGVLELFHRSLLTPDTEWIDFLGTLAGQASIAIDNGDMFSQLQRSNTELARAYDATIEGWANALEMRDTETEGHCRRVTDMMVTFASQMHFSEEEIVHIRRGAILHDIGKMAIPDSILFKKGPLTDAERLEMQKHTVYAYRLLSSIPFLQPALDIPYCHHERWDGNGYPRGLKGTEIPLVARMFAIVDVWDALRFDRPYRKGWSKEKVSVYIREQSGTHFDPDLVEVFLHMMEEKNVLREE